VNAIELAHKHLGQYKIHGKEIQTLYCPFCNGGGSKDKYTFSLSIDNGAYNCLRGSCGVRGNLYQLCKHFGEAVDTESHNIPVVKQYIKPKVKPTKLSPKTIEYLKKRGISQETADNRRLGEKDGWIAFPFYENGELVLVKYRPARDVKKGERKAGKEKGGKHVFWGLDECNPEYSLVIVEGEIDALSLDECGIKNVVSVPMGANNIECIQHGWEKLSKFNKVIIWVDNDKAGEDLRDKLILKLGAWRCLAVDSKWKDANLELLNEGKDSILKTYQSAKEVPIDNMFRMSEIGETEDVDYIKTKIAYLDKSIGGFGLGEVSVWTGRTGQGKSTFMSQMVIASIEQRKAVCMYAAEGRLHYLRDNLERNIAGIQNIRIVKHDDAPNSYYLTKITQSMVRKWYHDYLFCVNTVNVYDGDEVLSKFSEMARRYDCKTFVIDNLMSIRYGKQRQGEMYKDQSEFMLSVIRFAKKYNVHVHLVAHPRKTSGKTGNEPLSNSEILGSSDITNRADNVFAVYRWDKDADDNIKGYTSRISIMKNRDFGVQDLDIGLYYSVIDTRFNSFEDEFRQYSWNVNKQIETDVIEYEV